jgi:hypothetical protein
LILIGVGGFMVLASTVRYLLAPDEKKAKAAQTMTYAYMVGFLLIGLGLITFMPE